MNILKCKQKIRRQEGVEDYFHPNNLYVMYSTGQNELINGPKAEIEEFALRTLKGLKTPDFL